MKKGPGPLRGTAPKNSSPAPTLDRQGFKGVGLSASQKEEFQKQGVLTVENAMSPGLLSRVRAAVDRLHALAAKKKHIEQNGFLFLTNCVVEDDVFLELMENPLTFPLVWDMLGWNIFLYHSHLNITPPQAPGAKQEKKTLGWHQDSGRVNMDLEEHPRPRVSLKIAYWLTDTLVENCAPMYVIPGRQREDSMKMPDDKISNPPGAMPVRVKAGSATFFERRTWHAASPNWTDLTRKVVFMGYGYRWIRSKDNDGHPPAYMKRMDPIQRQLLGDGPWPNARFSPDHPDAVPLHALIRQIRGEDSVGPIPWGK